MNSRATMLLLLLLGGCASRPEMSSGDNRYSIDQQLIIAAFQLDVGGVERLLAGGANVNARFGTYDEHIFMDRRSLGYSSLGSERWTALQAVADSHRAPQPERMTENTSEARDEALRELKNIDPRLIEDRDQRRVEIAKVLIGAGARLDLNDGYGGTALAHSVYMGYDGLSLLLISSGAAVNTKTGIYIDGTGDITPLHRATKSPSVLQALLKRGAEVSARDSTGDTPLHWAVRDCNAESVRLLVDAGADVNARDKKGRTPMYWPGICGGDEKRIVALLKRGAAQDGARLR